MDRVRNVEVSVNSAVVGGRERDGTVGRKESHSEIVGVREVDVKRIGAVVAGKGQRGLDGNEHEVTGVAAKGLVEIAGR